MAQAMKRHFVDLPLGFAPLAGGRMVFRAGQHESGGNENFFRKCFAQSGGDVRGHFRELREDKRVRIVHTG